MSETTALEIALEYHRAWSSGRLGDAWRLLAADVVFDAPPGRLMGAEAVQRFMGPFAASLSSSTLIAALGTEDAAVVVYDTSNPMVASAPAAEWYQVRDELIVAGRIIFDRLPFALARGEVTRVPA